MSDKWSELEKLSESYIKMLSPANRANWNQRLVNDFQNAATPEAILALIAENRSLTQQLLSAEVSGMRKALKAVKRERLECHKEAVDSKDRGEDVRREKS